MQPTLQLMTLCSTRDTICTYMKSKHYHHHLSFVGHPHFTGTYSAKIQKIIKLVCVKSRVQTLAQYQDSAHGLIRWKSTGVEPGPPIT
jgi:hypothetical protein